MLRKPVTPSKGASTRRRATVARASSALACATLTAAALSSSPRWLMKPCATSSLLRLWLAWAIDNSASACCSCACGSRSSSCTSNWPLATFCPSRKLMCSTRALTSARTTVPWRERSEPTACTSSATACRRAAAASTATAGPAPRADAAGGARLGSAVPGARCSHHAAPTAAASATTAMTEVAVFKIGSPPRRRRPCAETFKM